MQNKILKIKKAKSSNQQRQMKVNKSIETNMYSWLEETATPCHFGMKMYKKDGRWKISLIDINQMARWYSTLWTLVTCCFSACDTWAGEGEGLRYRKVFGHYKVLMLAK